METYPGLDQGFGDIGSRRIAGIPYSGISTFLSISSARVLADFDLHRDQYCSLD